MANNYTINYNDERFQDVKADEKAALNEVDKTYGEMIGQSDEFYKAQIDANKQWEQKQTDIQNQQTDFAIQEIEQQKDQAKKDYTKEQSGAYVDWQKQSDQYGANAEAMAAQGMQNTGFSESSQVSMYNTYQNRVATARESYNLIVQDFNNAITEARLQNNAVLAEIAYKAQQERLELALEGFQYKNQLIIEMADKKTEVQNEYYGRWQDVLAQINHENALAEQVRQYNASLAEQQRQHNADMAFKEKQLAEQKRQYDQSFAEEQRQFNATLATKKSGGGGGKTITKTSNGGGNKDINKGGKAPQSAYDQLNAAIAAGAPKDKVSNAISLKLRNGEITKAQAAELRKTFTPRGYTY